MDVKCLFLLAVASFINQANASEGENQKASTLDEQGFIYEYGIGVPMDSERALQYYQQACELGGNYGCYNVRYFY